MTCTERDGRISQYFGFVGFEAGLAGRARVADWQRGGLMAGVRDDMRFSSSELLGGESKEI